MVLKENDSSLFSVLRLTAINKHNSYNPKSTPFFSFTELSIQDKLLNMVFI